MKRLRLIVLSLLIFQLPQISVNAASIKEGVNCQIVGKIYTSGKNSFICESALYGKVLIKQLSASKTSKSLNLSADNVISELSGLDKTIVTNFINSETQLREQLNALQARIIDLPVLIATAKNTKAQFEAEISSLPTRINQAKIIMEQSKAALTIPQQNYTSLSSQLNSLSYEYESAQRAKSAYLACRVLKDFGFLGSSCGSYNSYNDIVISRYNSLNSQVNAAKATYDSYNTTYNFHLQQYNNLVSSQLQLNLKVSEEQRKITELSQELNAKNLELKKSQSIDAIFSKVKNNQTYLLDSPFQLSESIQEVISKSSKIWSKQLPVLFRKSSLLQYEYRLIPIIQPVASPLSPSPSPSATSAPTTISTSGIIYTALLDRAIYAPGEVATLLITGKDASGNLVPDGTQLSSAQEIINAAVSPNNFLSKPKFSDTSTSGRWSYRFVIESAPGTYSGTFKIGNMAEQKIPYTVRSGG